MLFGPHYSANLTTTIFAPIVMLYVVVGCFDETAAVLETNFQFDTEQRAARCACIKFLCRRQLIKATAVNKSQIHKN